MSAFPSFLKQNYEGLDIGYLSYGGMMAGKSNIIFFSTIDEQF